MKLYLGHAYFSDSETGERFFAPYVLCVRWLMALVMIVVVGLTTVPFYALYTLSLNLIGSMVIAFAIPMCILSGWLFCIFALYDDRQPFRTVGGFLRRDHSNEDGTR